MARNKYPERTVAHILDISQQLFFDRGYDNTTMQDIIQKGDFSKGGIYHHFKSKKEIFDTIMNRYDNYGEPLSVILENKELSSLEKLKRIMIQTLSQTEKHQIMRSASSLYKDPKVFGEIIQKNFMYVEDITKILESGVEDGSITAKYPWEMAELFISFFNIWIGIGLYDVKELDFQRKVMFYKELFERMGLALLDEQIIKLLNNYYEIMTNRK